MAEKNIIVKKEMIAKLLFDIKSLNNKVIEYDDKNQNDIYKNCNHVFEDYYEKYEKTKKICLHCDIIQY
jgi:formylmethanofuran dehydrogenase subunit E